MLEIDKFLAERLEQLQNRPEEDPEKKAIQELIGHAGELGQRVAYEKIINAQEQRMKVEAAKQLRTAKFAGPYRESLHRLVDAGVHKVLGMSRKDYLAGLPKPEDEPLQGVLVAGINRWDRRFEQQKEKPVLVLVPRVIETRVNPEELLERAGVKLSTVIWKPNYEGYDGPFEVVSEETNWLRHPVMGRNMKYDNVSQEWIDKYVVHKDLVGFETTIKPPVIEHPGEPYILWYDPEDLKKLTEASDFVPLPPAWRYSPEKNIEPGRRLENYFKKAYPYFAEMASLALYGCGVAPGSEFTFAFDARFHEPGLYQDSGDYDFMALIIKDGKDGKELTIQPEHWGEMGFENTFPRATYTRK